MRSNKAILLAYLLAFLLLSPAAHGGEGDERDIFAVGVPPDVLILLDGSGSMAWLPSGQRTFYASSFPDPFQPGFKGPFYLTAASVPGPYGPVGYTFIEPDGFAPFSLNCDTGPFYKESAGRLDCSRMARAKEAIRQILDADENGNINANDEGLEGLNARIGFSYFRDGLICPSGSPACMPIGSRYRDVMDTVNNLWRIGATPLAKLLQEAKTNLDTSKAADPGRDCRQKFAILITDGADTLACSGNGNPTQDDQYKRRRESVAAAKALADAGYKVYVIGFGADMPFWEQNTLNWMAYFGGTDNPGAPNSGIVTAYNPVAVTSCANDSTGVQGGYTYALRNDPGGIGNPPTSGGLSGYAFIAGTATELNNALKAAFLDIKQARYSFSMCSVASSRLNEENYVIEGSFLPKSAPFWPGYLRKYDLDGNGQILSAATDAGQRLASRNPATRKIWTYRGGMQEFNTDNIQPEHLGLAAGDTGRRDDIVGFLRGEPGKNPEGWNLGDIFHSNPITIGTPSPYYRDMRDHNHSFDTFRANHARTSALGNRLVLAGANDGQLHAFDTASMDEKWSFIPPNLLPKLGYMAAPSAGAKHSYFVDGPVTAGDVWAGADDTRKSPTDWKTLLVFGLGRGVRDENNQTSKFLWSKSSSCDSDFKSNHAGNEGYNYYCGYYALDITDTSANPPVFKWVINADNSMGDYLGEPWGKMAIGKVLKDGKEKWVGFIGGGNAAAFKDGNDLKTGKTGQGFFVIDLDNGTKVWAFTNADNTSEMKYSLPGTPAIVDTDFDGFIDTAYIGDTGGNMWRFTFCTAGQGSSCGTGQWAGTLLFRKDTGERPVYTKATVAATDSIWVFWGTGDKTDPGKYNSNDRFYAVKDHDRLTTHALGSLQNISVATEFYNGTGPGWYLALSGNGEKMLAEPFVFGGIALFTTYTPTDPAQTNPCLVAGVGKLYAIAMKKLVLPGLVIEPGKGAFSDTGKRSVNLGIGIPSAPVISLRPKESKSKAADLFVAVSGGGGTATAMTSGTDPDSPLGRILGNSAPNTTLIHWRDQRVR